jgi:hypothetical protein
MKFIIIQDFKTGANKLLIYKNSHNNEYRTSKPPPSEITYTE